MLINLSLCLTFTVFPTISLSVTEITSPDKIETTLKISSLDLKCLYIAPGVIPAFLAIVRIEASSNPCSVNSLFALFNIFSIVTSLSLSKFHLPN